jgi:hypothetical protein
VTAQALLSLGLVALAVTGAAGVPARAGLLVECGTGNRSLAGRTENFDSRKAGAADATLLPSGIQISFQGNAAPVLGSAASLYVAPELSGANGTGFGAGGTTQKSGPDRTIYLSTGSSDVSPGAKVQLLMPGAQRYFGLLWGSVDANDALSFYSGATLVGSLDGTDISVASGVDGTQGAAGTSYANVLFTGDASYDRVILSSTQYAFEFDDVAFSERAPIPEPMTGAVVGTAVLGLGLARLSRRR